VKILIKYMKELFLKKIVGRKQRSGFEREFYEIY
jgi:hypothetical protein